MLPAESRFSQIEERKCTFYLISIQQFYVNIGVPSSRWPADGDVSLPQKKEAQTGDVTKDHNSRNVEEEEKKKKEKKVDRHRKYSKRSTTITAMSSLSLSSVFIISH